MQIIFRTSDGNFGQASTNVRNSASATISGHSAADAFAAPEFGQSRFSRVFWPFWEGSNPFFGLALTRIVMFSFLLDGSDGGALSQWSIALAGGFLGSIVGAIIGGKYAVGAVKTADTLIRSNEAKHRAEELRARRVALNAELEHILETAAKISEKVKAYELSPTLLSWDFLEACRLDWYKADPDTEFVKALAQAYQEVVFANESVNYVVNIIREMCKGGEVPIEFQNSLSQTLKVPIAEVQRTAGTLQELNAGKLASMAK